MNKGTPFSLKIACVSLFLLLVGNGVFAEADVWSSGASWKGIKNHTSVSYNGKIYSFGGVNNYSIPSNAVEIYDIATNSWSTGTAGGTARSDHSSVVYNGKVYSWGGLEGGNKLDIYDIATNSWSTGVAGGTGRALFSSVVYNGKIYSWGGLNNTNFNRLNTLDIYDIATNSWSTGVSGGTARVAHSSVVHNGKIYSWGGGAGDALIPVNTIDIYDIATNSWSTGTAGGSARQQHTSVLHNGKMYSFGGGMGQGGTIPVNVVDIYDTVTNSWSSGVVGGSFRTDHSSAIHNGKIYLWGGVDVSAPFAFPFVLLNTLDIYQIATVSPIVSIEGVKSIVSNMSLSSNVANKLNHNLDIAIKKLGDSKTKDNGKFVCNELSLFKKDIKNALKKDISQIQADSLIDATQIIQTEFGCVEKVASSQSFFGVIWSAIRPLFVFLSIIG